MPGQWVLTARQRRLCYVESDHYSTLTWLSSTLGLTDGIRAMWALTPLRIEIYILPSHLLSAVALACRSDLTLLSISLKRIDLGQYNFSDLFVLKVSLRTLIIKLLSLPHITPLMLSHPLWGR